MGIDLAISYAGAVRWLTAPLALLVLAIIVPASAFGHAERWSYFPNHKLGHVPKYKKSGPSLVVCKADSRKLIRGISTGSKKSKAARQKSLALLPRCKYRHIQAAVNAAKNGTRILILPGTYKEEPSRAVANDDGECTGDEYQAEEPGTKSYKFQRDCPNSQNLIAITGDDDDPDRRCDDKCNLQIEGTGARPSDVKVIGGGYGLKPGAKLNVFRADRADGIYFRNFLVQYSDFNNIYVLETNGFRVEDVRSRWSREYGVLSFTSDNGLYNRVKASGAGDSGIYPGSGPEGHCKRYGIEVSHSESFGNTIGWSGTAGNGTYTHDSKFHDNSTGITMDSFASGHPGMPQDCSKWERNRIYSNNAEPVQRQARRLLPGHAERGARPAQGLPHVPGAGGHRHPHGRRQRQHLQEELDLRQLAPRHDALLGPGGDPRHRPDGAIGQAEHLRHLAREQVHRQPDGDQARRPPRA